MKKQLLSVLSTLLLAGSITAQTTLISPTGDGGFENGSTFAANNWTLVNYAATTNSNWYITSAPISNGTYNFTPSGSNAAYISNNNGVNWRYNTSAVAGSVHLYRDVAFPAGETNINLSFKWNASGETTEWDVLYVYLAPTTRTPVTGTPSSNSNAVTGWSGTGTSTLVGVYYQLAAGSGTTTTVSLPASLAGTTKRLVFTWKNDGGGGTEPPAALDNISLTSSSCGLAPTALNSTTVTPTSANYTWTPGGTEAAWDVYYGPQPLTAPTASTAATATTSTASYSLTGLPKSTPYSIYVRANCGGGVYGNWTAAKTFTTLTTCPTPSNVTISAITPTTAVSTWTAGGTETSWFVKYSAPTVTATVGSLTYPLTGLTPSTTYSIQVRAYCGVGDTSLYTTIKTFSTLCQPADVSGIGNTRCGIGSTTLTATSSNTAATMKWYAASSGGTAISTGSLYVTPSISVTTTYYATSTLAGCESSRIPVTATVTAPPALSLTTGTTVCANSVLMLNVTSTVANFDSYVWSPNTFLYTDAAATIPYAGGSASTVYYKTNAANTNVYTVNALNSGSGCANVATTQITGLQPSINASATPTTVCSGSPVNLNATTNVIAAGTVAVGTTTTNLTGATSQPTAFCNRWPSYRMQTVYTAAELTALGLRAGNITAISYSISSLGDANNNPAFIVKCGTTTLSTFTDFIPNATFSTVFPSATYTHSVGLNTITFATPYNWDGVSNLVVEVTHNGADLTNNSQTYYTPTAGNTVAWSNSGAATGTPSTNRLNIIFAGQTGSQGAGSLTWQWNPGAINSNTTTVNPVNTGTNVSTASYTVTGTDGATTCTNSAVVSVSVNPLPAMPTTVNSSQCGLGVPTASVNGGTSYKWYTTPTSTVVIQAGSSATFTNSINSTKTWYVASFNGTCESVRAMITASVTIPDPIVAASTSTALCPGQTATLTATPTGTNNVYSYTWTATPATGSGMPTPVTSSVAPIAPTTAGTYNYLITGVDGVCTTTASINVMMSNLPNVTATASPTMICSGSPVNLNATTSNIAAGMIAVGTTTTNLTGATVQPTAFCNRWPSYRMQTVYTAAELTALGMNTGNITSISYSISTLGDGATNPNYTVKCGTTTVNAFTDFIPNTTFSTVFPSATYTHSVGLNTINFATPYNWDGVSNLVVEVTHDGADLTNNSQTYYTPTAGNTVAWSNSGAATGTPSTNRLNVIFGAQTISQTASGINWQWNPGAINSNTTVVNPVNTGTNVSTASYTITGTSVATTCSNTAVVSISVNPLPATPVASNSSQCGIGVPTASVSGGTSYKWYSTPTSTTVLQAGASANFTAAINATTSWYVTSYNGTCESSPRVLLTASVTIPDGVTASSTSTAVCPGTTFTLTATKSGSANTYAYTWTASPSAGSGIATSVAGATAAATPTTAGTYNYLVTAIDGVCTTTASINVTLNMPPNISNAMSTPTMVCSGNTVALSAISVSATSSSTVTGLQSTTSITGGPYRQGAGSDNKAQYLFTAAELTAAGFAPGNFTALSFSVTSNGTGAMNNFTIKMGNTASTTLGTNYDAAPPVVYGPVAYTTVAGLNTHTFATPFNWNGTSNVIVEVCHDVVSGGSSSTIGQESVSNRVIYSNVAGACALTSGTSNTTRPTITFAAQVGTNVTSSINFVWNPGALPGSTVAATPINTGTTAITTVYTVTATNPGTGCTNTATTSVLVNPVPTVPVAFNSTQCGLAVPTASVSGGTAYRWYATSTSTTVLQAGANANYTTAINSTTTWYVSSYNANCESGRAAVTATVTIPDAVTATSTSSAVCPGQSFTLTATKTGTNNVYTYTWTANPAAGSGIASSITGSTTPVTPVTAGTHAYIVTASDAVCTTTAGVNVITTAPPNILTTVTPSMSCSGASVTLNATAGTIASGTVGIGAPTLTLSAFGDAGNPYNHWYGGQKEQYIFTAAELSATGLTSGNITSLSFDVVSSTALTMANFSMTIGHTTQSAASATALITTGLNPVYFNASQGVTAGLNNYVFSTPFNWNGTDNVVVSLSWSNVNSGNTALTASVRAHDAGFSSTGYLYADNTAASALAGATNNTSPGVGGTSQNSVTNNRPDIVFTGQILTQGAAGLTWQWNPGAINSNTTTVAPVNPGTIPTHPTYTISAIDPVTTCSNTAVVTLTVNPIPSVTVAASTNSLCSGTSASLTATGATSYAWLPAGGSSSVAVVSPGATTVYTVTGTSLGCTNTKTVSLSVTATPTVIASASPSVICSGSTTSLTVSGAASYSWSPLASTSASVTATPTIATVYTVTGTTSGCSNTKTVSVTVNNIPTLTVTANPAAGALCTTGATATLSAVGTSTSYAWSNGVNTATTSVAPTTTTTYTVIGTNSCGTKTATTTIAVATSPTISATPVSTLSCANHSVVLTANATAGVSYSWNTGATTMSITVSPSVTTTYTVTGTNACGSATTTVVQNVSPCTGIEEMTTGSDISIYPNPANAHVNVSIPAYLATANTVIEVTDALGKLVMKEVLNTDVTTLRIDKLEEGVYFFKVISNNQVIKVGKVVKQ